MDYGTLLEIFKTQLSYSFHELGQYHLGQRFVIICVYAVLSKIADLFVDRLLLRLAIRTSFEADERLVKIIHRPIYISVFLLGFMHAVMIQPVLAAPWNVVLPNVIKTLILMVWWVSLIREISAMNENNMGWIIEKIDKTHFYMIKNISRIIILFTGILWGLVIWNVNLTPLFASAGIIGIAIALAAKDTLANFFGGIALFVDRAYKVGDYILLDTGGRGEVVEVGIRSTKVKTRDDILVTIPNSIMSTTMIINQSAPVNGFRIRIDIGVGYNSDLRVVEKTLLGIAAQNQALAKKPEPRVRARSFGPSAINFQLLVWVTDPRHRGRQTHNLIKMIHIAFQEQGIEIPVPQQDVYVKEIPGTGVKVKADEQRVEYAASSCGVTEVTKQDVPIMKYVKVNKLNISNLFALNRKLAIDEGQENLFVADKKEYEQSFLTETPLVHGILVYDNDKPVGFCVYVFKFSTYLGKKVLYIEDIYLKGNYKSTPNIEEFLHYLSKLMKDEECCRLEMRVLHQLNIGLDELHNFGLRKIAKWDVYRFEKA